MTAVVILGVATISAHADNRNEKWMGAFGAGAGGAAGGVAGQTLCPAGAVAGAGAGSVIGQAVGEAAGRAVDKHAESLKETYPGVEKDPRYHPGTLLELLGV